MADIVVFGFAAFGAGFPPALGEEGGSFGPFDAGLTSQLPWMAVNASGSFLTTANSSRRGQFFGWCWDLQGRDESGSRQTVQIYGVLIVS